MNLLIILNFISSLLFFLPYLLTKITIDTKLDWLCISSIIFSLIASIHHLIPSKTQNLTFIVKSLYTQFLLSLLSTKINYSNELLIITLIISICDLLPIINITKYETYLGLIRQIICFIIWYLSEDKLFTLVIYIIGQLFYLADRNLRFNYYNDRSNYTYYHVILHICDSICFYYWMI